MIAGLGEQRDLLKMGRYWYNIQDQDFHRARTAVCFQRCGQTKRLGETELFETTESRTWAAIRDSLGRPYPATLRKFWTKS
jgi:hypothetical protein